MKLICSTAGQSNSSLQNVAFVFMGCSNPVWLKSGPAFPVGAP